tara:strand:- start:80 stop:313 length:234 start_codon:yes stop_codon:yes gene_type:complete
MEFHSYIFLGVGVAISVLGFFLKKEAKKATELEERMRNIEMLWHKNEARDGERWREANKLLEDRRQDVRKIYDLLSK